MAKIFIDLCLTISREFFERMTPELHLQNEFRDWFALPFVVSPESHPTFSAYFGRQVSLLHQYVVADFFLLNIFFRQVDQMDMPNLVIMPLFLNFSKKDMNTILIAFV